MTASVFTPSALALVLAFAIDRLWGELPARVHPVVWIGNATQLAMRAAPSAGRVRQLLFGLCVALLVPGLAAALAAGVLLACGSSLVRVPVEALLLSAMFALRALGEAARRVHGHLQHDHLDRARHALRDLCSRDPSQLAPHEIAAATIESTAENTSDSVVAPLFYYALLGLPGAAAYRAVNTLDAMIGYRGRYEYLGKAAARLDDALNVVPARLTALLLVIAGALSRARVGEGVRTWWRDARNTESPNAGHPMAAMAGLLGVQLEKRDCYALGAGLRAPAADDIARGWRIASRAGWLALGLALALGVRGDAG